MLRRGVAWARRDALVIIFFAVLSLIIMRPILSDPRTLVIGPPGDNVQYVYMTGWVAQALLLGESPFIDPRLNFPDVLYLTATDMPLLNHIAVAPATWALGPVFGYNLIMLVAHLLSGYLIYLWVRSLTGSAAGGFVAGMLLLLAPYRIIRSMGQPGLASVYVLVLFFWALEHALRAARPEARRLVLLGFATFLVGLTAQYYLVMGLISGVIYALLRRWREPLWLLRAAGPFALSVICGTLIAMIPSFMALSTGAYTHYSVQDGIRGWSLDPLSFVTPAATHPLWGAFFQGLHPEGSDGEQTLYLGVVGLALAGAGVVFGRRKGMPIWTWLGVVLAAAIFAIGTDLHISGQAVSGEQPIWLPTYYLARLPLINLIRVWSRFGVVAQIFVALLAGIGAAGLASRSGRPLAVGLGLSLLVVIDFLPGTLPTSTVAPRLIDRWLAAQPGDFAVAFLPPGKVNPNYEAMYGSLFHGKHLPAFNHPEHRPKAYLDFQRRADKFPDRDSLEALRALGLRYLLIDRNAYDGLRWPGWDVVEPILRSYPDVQIDGEQGGIVIVALE